MDQLFCVSCFTKSSNFFLSLCFFSVCTSSFSSATFCFLFCLLFCVCLVLPALLTSSRVGESISCYTDTNFNILSRFQEKVSKQFSNIFTTLSSFSQTSHAFLIVHLQSRMFWWNPFCLFPKIISLHFLFFLCLQQLF